MDTVARTHNRVALPTHNYVGRGSHTTVHADLAYGGLPSIQQKLFTPFTALSYFEIKLVNSKF